MKFAIKTNSMPLMLKTDDWMAGENSKTGRPFLSIGRHIYSLDAESFEMIYFMSQNQLFDDNMTLVFDRGHVDIWGF
jgi:hypothetical protein